MTNLLSFRILPCGDSGLTVEFGSVIDPDLNTAVLNLDRAIRAAAVVGVIETVPTYRSLFVHYDAVVVNFEAMSDAICDVAANAEICSDFVPGKKWHVPVVYGGEFGIDLDDLAERSGVSCGEFIARHSAPCYRVYMVGFSAGFTYLGGLDPLLECPRRDEPRLLTPSGSITLGGQQTAIQSLAGPTGWHLLGRTPVRSYHPGREPMFLFQPGDSILFHPIPARDWALLDQAGEAGERVAELAD